MEFLRKVTMKTHGHYKTLSAIKQQTEIVDILVKRREVKNSKVRLTIMIHTLSVIEIIFRLKSKLWDFNVI